MKTTVETESMQIAKHPEERILIDIMGVLGGPQQVHREPEHTLVVRAHELLEGDVIARLSRPDQRAFLHRNARLKRHGRSGLSLQRATVLPRQRATCPDKELTRTKSYSPCQELHALPKNHTVSCKNPALLGFNTV